MQRLLHYFIQGTGRLFKSNRPPQPSPVDAIVRLLREQRTTRAATRPPVRPPEPR